MSLPPQLSPGRNEFIAYIGGEEEEPAADDPRPQRPAGSVDQGVRGTNRVSVKDAWRQYLAERLR